MEHNFAVMEVQRAGTDVEIKVAIKNYYDEEVFARTYLLQRDL